MVNEKVEDFFLPIYESLNHQDLDLLKIILNQVKDALKLCSKKLNKSYIITFYKLIISYILQNNLSTEFYRADKDILKVEFNILKTLKKYFHYLETNNEDNKYYEIAWLYFYLFEKYIDIDFERCSFSEDNKNKGRTILNKVRLNSIYSDIKQAQETKKELQRSLEK